MFSERVLFLLLVSAIFLNNQVFGGESNDRIDVILSQIIGMNKRIDVLVGDVRGVKTDVSKLKKHVGTIAETEEMMEMKVVKIEDAVQKIVKKEGEMDSKMGNVEREIGSGKSEISGVKSEMKEQSKKTEKIDENLKPLNWVFIGRGEYGSRSDSITDFMPSFQQCVKFCDRKRLSDGYAWNGLTWYMDSGSCYCYKNDEGHDASYQQLKVDSIDNTFLDSNFIFPV